ncbi:carbamoyl phosphate synthase large subunit [Bacillus sp. FJAT-42376]|uniref:carbamoyl phosphate synthase large subunit n=1 Tax=Bacillus sp. FJAT-42376 TaxID=2014076 RepID=UPI000F4DDA6D|nr:carbamoyl phosphate synthase large subunit [Bacillus sp. FJAT-42376]AZB42344.1 carbamoyl phosphate synthase large subunit [Bacillus sp. FJAT-42376]
MPKDETVKRVLVIGSGPIIIGQAAEFDYSGTQACLALKEEGCEVILLNNNPATIMTDPDVADTVYFEPMTADFLERIIQKEKPDGLLPTVGGQTGLNLALELDEKGILEKYGVKLLGTSAGSIRQGEDREQFRKLMHELNEPIPESLIVKNVEKAAAFAETIGYPIIIRPAYTLGGKGGGIAHDERELLQKLARGLEASPIHQCLIEKSIAGFKEVEYEVMRDAAGTSVTICNMENFDPVGIHTGDSIVVAPSQTLTDTEYQMLRQSALRIIGELGIIGGCNIQFALDPESKQYFVIEVNPRVSRSSALASKATGYPIARIAAKLALGFTLSELKNPLTETTYASFEPALDYAAVKFPRWPFDKFKDLDRLLGTKMKATGEVMALARNMEAGFLKALDSLELDTIGAYSPELAAFEDAELDALLTNADDRRFFAAAEKMRRGSGIEAIHSLTRIDRYFLAVVQSIVQMEKDIQSASVIEKENLSLWKEKGFSDESIAFWSNRTESEVKQLRNKWNIRTIYKMVDTCAGEFEARTNYFYSSYFGEQDLIPEKTEKKRIVIIGSGPNRIGQGIEFDYSAVHGIKALKKMGCEAIMINSNPETVSTDYELADRLYFEPLTFEYVMNVIEHEQADAVIVQYGGQTAINLAEKLWEAGVPLLGTDHQTLFKLEDRDAFYQLLDECGIDRVKGTAAQSAKEAILAAKAIGFPVLLRPSYVIGGKGMAIAKDEDELRALLKKAEPASFPVLVDQFVSGNEAELDLVSDGENVWIPLVMEHIERAGIHSGDSMAVLPAQSYTEKQKSVMKKYASAIARRLHYKGIMNIQFILADEKIYVLEVNPRASRTAPLVSKIVQRPVIEEATAALLGGKISDHTDPVSFTAVKFPVFSTHALHDQPLDLGPEMKATGEGMCIGATLEEALSKVFDDGKEKPVLLDEPVLKNEQIKSCVLYSPATGSDDAARKAALAYGQRVITNHETFMAFQKGKAAGTGALKPIQSRKEVGACTL